MRSVAVVCCLVLCSDVCQAQEKKAIEVSRIRLYLPDAPLRQRIGKDVTPLADYVKSLEKEITSFWEETEQPKAKGLLVAVGIKPGKKSRLWCDAIEGEIPAEMLSKLEKKLAEVPTIAVKEAPIAFALEVRLWGQKPDKFPEIPKAWVDAAKKSKVPLMIPDELFKVVWPE